MPYTKNWVRALNSYAYAFIFRRLKYHIMLAERFWVRAVFSASTLYKQYLSREPFENVNENVVKPSYRPTHSTIETCTPSPMTTSTMYLVQLLKIYGKRLMLLVVFLTALYLTSLNISAVYYRNYPQVQYVESNLEVRDYVVRIIPAKNPNSTSSSTTRVIQSPDISIAKGGTKECSKGQLRSGYCVLSNYIRAERSVGFNDSVTLTTQGTADFLRHIGEVCRRWNGPISLTVYAPESDFKLALERASSLRNCGKKCVKEWVTWHFLYDADHSPSQADIASVSEKCQPYKANANVSYVSRNKLAYPINVARNVARIEARTKYIFASDIELYPSDNVIPEFLKLMAKRAASQRPPSRKEVYVLPVFEVSSAVKSTPRRKNELTGLYTARKAVSFHRYTCNSCHQIPDLSNWLMRRLPNDTLGVFKTVKRVRAQGLQNWEPFFIGTNEFPYFDESLTWNGKSNKMQVALEMCILDFDFHILDNAFLVHAPGIKVYKKINEKDRIPFIKRNNKRFRELKRKLKSEYHGNNNCF